MNTDAKLEEHHVIAMENVCPTTNISQVAAAAFGYIAPEYEPEFSSCAPAVPQLRICPVGWSIGSTEVPTTGMWLAVAEWDAAAAEQSGTPATNSLHAISVW